LAAARHAILLVERFPTFFLALYQRLSPTVLQLMQICYPVMVQNARNDVSRRHYNAYVYSKVDAVLRQTASVRKKTILWPITQFCEVDFKTSLHIISAQFAYHK